MQNTTPTVERGGGSSGSWTWGLAQGEEPQTPACFETKPNLQTSVRKLKTKKNFTFGDI